MTDVLHALASLVGAFPQAVLALVVVAGLAVLLLAWLAGHAPEQPPQASRLDRMDYCADSMARHPSSRPAPMTWWDETGEGR